MLSAQLNHLIMDGKLEIFTVVKVVGFTDNSVVAKAPAKDKVDNKIITLHEVDSYWSLEKKYGNCVHYSLIICQFK